MSAEIAVFVRLPEEMELARALVTGLPQLSFKLLFGTEDLRTRFGPTQLPSSVDLGRFFVEPEAPRLALCFSGGRELGPNSNLLWLSFLNEIGVPTIEIQRELLQDTAAAASESVARHYLSWGGAHGIGDLKTVPAAPAPGLLRDDAVVVSSRLDGGSYREEERVRFVFAVLRLARENPEHTFLWRPAASETAHSEAAPLRAVLEKLAPKNLVIEDHETFPQLLARCRFVIGMAATALLDAAALRKPGLIFVGDDRAEPLGGLSGRTFQSYAELREAWTELRRTPERFAIESSLPAFSSDAVAQRLAALALPPEPAPGPDIMPIALRYLAYYQENRGRAELGKLTGTVTALDKRISGIERQGEKLQEQLLKTFERIGVLQRSSVAYKALKLLGSVRKGALKR